MCLYYSLFRGAIGYALPAEDADIIVQNKLSFLEGCILKRLHRWRTKGNPVEDLKKMKHEIDLLIKLEAMPEEGR